MNSARDNNNNQVMPGGFGTGHSALSSPPAMARQREFSVVTPEAGGVSEMAMKNSATGGGGGAAPADLPEVIKLDVGGFKFTTTRSTLCRVPDSYMAAMFSGRHHVVALNGDDGSYFIDRDGSHFRHILNYLRSGGVLTLPKDASEKEELLGEIDFYGLHDMGKAICCPKVDVAAHLPANVIKQQEAEAELRQAFVKGEAAGFDPFHRLVPLFGENADIKMPLKYNPESKIRANAEYLSMQYIRPAPDKDKAPPPVTVKTLEEFETNFNREWPNLLHRLKQILLDEPIVIAGGSVLRCLTASKKIRTSKWWGCTSDIDIFVYCRSKEEANRISRRIFYEVSADNERWIVVRCRGVINIHKWRDDNGGVEMKIQIVLRLYDSPAEVLIGFDVDCCCCAYDGRNVWASPRCVESIKSGVNVLNPLHAWPNKPSYELRLAKYAWRGFAVATPGLDKSRIDYNVINQSNLGELKGMARFVKVAAEMDSAPTYERRLWRNRGMATIERPRAPREVPTLRQEAIACVSEDERYIHLLDFGYDNEIERMVVADVYDTDGDGIREYLWAPWSIFPRSADSRDEGWQAIIDAGEEHPEGVERRLVDAWESDKRSREYVNGMMDKYDLDNMYYSKAYKDVDDSEEDDSDEDECDGDSDNTPI